MVCYGSVLTWHQINGDEAQCKKVKRRIIVLQHVAKIHFFLKSADEELFPEGSSVDCGKTNESLPFENLKNC